MVSLPVGEFAVDAVATPLELIVPEPITVLVVRSVNVTLPPTGKLPVLVTVAVNVTVKSTIDGFELEARVILICAGFTVCTREPDAEE